jgi:hypothetical protein
MFTTDIAQVVLFPWNSHQGSPVYLLTRGSVTGRGSVGPGVAVVQNGKLPRYGLSLRFTSPLVRQEVSSSEQANYGRYERNLGLSSHWLF